MLKQFQIPDGDVIRVDSYSLRKVVKDIFINCGVSEIESEIGSDVLVSTDLRGVDTHGVSNMLRIYVKDYQDGKLNPSSNIILILARTPHGLNFGGSLYLSRFQSFR